MPVPVTIRIGAPLSAVTVAVSQDGSESSLGGSQQTLQAQHEELKQSCLALEDAANKFHGLQDEFFREAEEQLVSLAVEIARKILAQEIEEERYKIDPIVSEALSNVSACKQVVVHLHPDDLAQCELAREQDESADSPSLSFVPDTSVQRAQCVLETSQGTVEVAVETQLNEIAKALKNPE